MKIETLAILVVAILLVAFIEPTIPFDEAKTYLEKVAVNLDILAKLAATITLLGLLYQIRKNRQLKEADFVLNLNQRFIESERITKIYSALEASKESDQQTNPFSSKDIIDMANYLSFFGPFHGLIEHGLLSIKTIDILAYRFFLATNNKYMQEMLLCNEKKVVAWKVIYKLHKKWKKYRLENYKKEEAIWQPDYDLEEKAPRYNEMVGRIS